VEVAEAAEDFDLAVAPNVPGRAESRRDLVAPAEADSLEARGLVVAGEALFIQTKPHVEGEALMDSPGVLRVKGVVPAADFAGRGQVADVHRAPESLARAAVRRSAPAAVLR